MSGFLDRPLQYKIISICVFANIIIFVVNIFLLLGINSMSMELEMVYQDNRHLNHLSDALSDVQDSMTEYLRSKSSDSLSTYYNTSLTYKIMIDQIDGRVTELSFGRMERNIKYMSRNYLSEVEETIKAKRGRNVEKYSTYYENATELYNYINEYITSLNLELFVSNSQHYSELSELFRTYEFISFIVITIVMGGNIMIITSLVGAIIQPLKKLADSANEVAEGNFDAELIEITSNDEVGIVSNAFNKMLISIKQYIEQLRMSMEKERNMQEKELMMESHLKDAKLKYLQAQINPHFLFNTLNAGAQLAMMEGADKTYEYVQTVADFFRYNVKGKKNEVTIGEEVTLVDNYIRILNVRFSGDIGYEKLVDNRLLKAEMPNMILQPIVENAVNHGIREMGNKGKITLKVYRQDNFICISIGDNGKGISKENIDRILNGSWERKQDQNDNNGIGMDNVISRLRLFTENEDAVEIKSEGENKGCEVIIRLPLDEANRAETEI